MFETVIFDLDGVILNNNRNTLSCVYCVTICVKIFLKKVCFVCTIPSI